jgi:hypothetical protein
MSSVQLTLTIYGVALAIVGGSLLVTTIFLSLALASLARRVTAIETDRAFGANSRSSSE